MAGNLSGQSTTSVLHPQQTLHPPGNIPETGQNQLLQPLKPSPSSDNLYSAFTSDGAISVPSLSAPGQGKQSKQPSSSKNCRICGKSLKSNLLLRSVEKPADQSTACLLHTYGSWAGRGSWVMIWLGELIALIRWNCFF